MKNQYCECEPHAVCGRKKYHPTEHNSFLIGRPVINYCIYCGKEKQSRLTDDEADTHGNAESLVQDVSAGQLDVRLMRGTETMINDYCIENDMARQQEEACIAKEKRSKVKLDLLLSLQYVNCAIGNMLTKMRTVHNGVGGQVLGMDNPEIMVKFSRRQYDDLNESLHILHRQIEELVE